MIKKTAFRITLAIAFAISPLVGLLGESNQMIGREHPYVFHLVQAELWQATLAEAGQRILSTNVRRRRLYARNCKPRKVASSS